MIGKTFWRGVLGRVGGVEDLGTALDALETRGLIQRRSASRLDEDVEYSFKHDLILDTAYATLPARDTARTPRGHGHHVGVARWAPERRSPGSSPTTGERLGTLIVRAAVSSSAAEHAVDALAVEETRDLFTQALDLAADPAEQTRDKTATSASTHSARGLRARRRRARRADPESGWARRRSKPSSLALTPTLWTEQSSETMACAELALELARAGGFAELEPVALGLLGNAHGMRGEEGDLERAVQLGDRALEMWVPNTRKAELAEQYFHACDHYYWTGDYERAMEAAQLAATTAGVDLHSREFRLRGAGIRAIILAGVGRYEDAISAAQDAIELATEMGRPMSVVTNYSTLPLRGDIRAGRSLGAE